MSFDVSGMAGHIVSRLLLGFYLLIAIGIYVLLIVLVVLAIRALLKYLRDDKSSKEKAEIRKPLGESLKEHRLRCNMTQEFVAETIGVSRQAVSKWENGTSEPSTTNLCALAKLYNVALSELWEEAPREEKKGKTVLLCCEIYFLCTFFNSRICKLIHIKSFNDESSSVLI